MLEINRAGAELARKLADEYSRAGQARFVAGSIGPSGKLPSMNDPDLSNITFDELVDVFRQQAGGLKIFGAQPNLLDEFIQHGPQVRARMAEVDQQFRRFGT